MKPIKLTACLENNPACLIVPIILPVGVFIAWLIFVIQGSIKASNGEPHTFPLTIKIL